MDEKLIANGFRITFEGAGAVVWTKVLGPARKVTFWIEDGTYTLRGYNSEHCWTRKGPAAAWKQLVGYDLVEELLCYRCSAPCAATSRSAAGFPSPSLCPSCQALRDVPPPTCRVTLRVRVQQEG